ncbi:hypothetical protein BC937DRAFT_93721, partial [Endogone sp. FLAS-F59071]
MSLLSRSFSRAFSNLRNSGGGGGGGFSKSFPAARSGSFPKAFPAARSSDGGGAGDGGGGGGGGGGGANVNKAILIGRVGRDAEVNHISESSSVLNYTLATSHVTKDKAGNTVRHTQWHRIENWSEANEWLPKAIKKGALVYLEGQIIYHEYEDKDESIQILKRAPDHEGKEYEDDLNRTDHSKAHDRDSRNNDVRGRDFPDRNVRNRDDDRDSRSRDVPRNFRNRDDDDDDRNYRSRDVPKNVRNRDDDDRDSRSREVPNRNARYRDDDDDDRNYRSRDVPKDVRNRDDDDRDSRSRD